MWVHCLYIGLLGATASLSPAAAAQSEVAGPPAARALPAGAGYEAGHPQRAASLPNKDAAAAAPMAPALVGASGAQPTRAKNDAVMQVNWPVDVAITAGSLLLYGLTERPAKMGLALRPSCPLGPGGTCNPAALWRADRASLRRTSRGWARTSEALQLGSVAAGLAAVLTGASEPSPAGRGLRMASEGLIFVETMAVAAVGTNVLKWAVRRPRPANYRQAEDARFDDQLSFPSGHTTTVATAATAAVTMLSQRHNGPWFWTGGAVVGTALTALTATGRVLGGRHFLSDVLAGAAMGLAVGSVVPRWHFLPVQVRAGPLGGGGALIEVSSTL